MEKSQIKNKCIKMLNRLINKARDFGNISCVPDGLMNIMKIYLSTGIVPDELKYSSQIGYDYDYFAFSKSTKSLLAIRQLLNSKEYIFTEDCFMLIRSIFENHILSRYVRENIDNDKTRRDVVDNFILAPLGISFDFYISKGRAGVFSQENEKIGDIKNPSSLIMGMEKEYYRSLYSFLCQYTHCSYGAASCYLNKGSFNCYGNNFFILTYLLTIFVFTKMYEGVVTVNGEDLVDTRTMKAYYNLAYDSLELQMEMIDYLIDYYNNVPSNDINIVIEKYIGVGKFDNSNLKISNMLKKMKESLFDNEIGNLNKSEFKGGKFIRKYQEW
ncbi:hypothetical protein SR42_14265 [Clostridium botulinum]|uniref:hypothetical protein n=1 Tax=Clostridium botulinum TaxID=1491 RepID=UPI000597A165|nr:hypothetical protein [Clostridium botulinum]KIL07344.1 hypothetical protein SR42_14265 [Clostridium botulinum]MBY6934385.1 hypothetical protein [Clostridium botulinum]NFL83350.1 hypothetical protein [Clostridium botulinum]NFN12198.1 hypothetical protein [Clostridium botulinum]NFO37635.1 hypothetical protein [Clostridium botulinum]